MSIMEDKDLEGLRSVPSDMKIRLGFFNTTHTYVRIIWINFDGKKQEYVTLKPRTIAAVSSYDKHFWIVEDYISQGRMLANHCRVFRAIDQEYILRYMAEGEANSRTFMVMITHNGPPSLQYIALKNACSVLKGPNDKNIMELPRVLQEDIRRYYKKQKLVDHDKNTETT